MDLVSSCVDTVRALDVFLLNLCFVSVFLLNLCFRECVPPEPVLGVLNVPSQPVC